VSCVELLNPVARLVIVPALFQVTIEPVWKLVPVIVMAVVPDPAVAVEGLMPVLLVLIEGAAPTVKITLGDTDPPVFNTETSAVPAVVT
jgi:hypothetical protein